MKADYSHLLYAFKLRLKKWRIMFIAEQDTSATETFLPSCCRFARSLHYHPFSAVCRNGIRSLVPPLIGPPSHWSPTHWSPNSLVPKYIIGAHWSPISLVPHIIGPPSHWPPFSLVTPSSANPNGPPSHWSHISLVPHLIGPPTHQSPISLVPQLAMHHPFHWSSIPLVPPTHWSPISMVPHLIGPPMRPWLYSSHWFPILLVPQCDPDFTVLIGPPSHWSPNATLISQFSLVPHLIGPRMRPWLHSSHWSPISLIPPV